MRISFQAAVWICAVFAVVSLAVALTAFTGLGTLTDQGERDVAAGYAWFWTFLGVIALVFGVLSWMISRGKLGKIE